MFNIVIRDMYINLKARGSRCLSYLIVFVLIGIFFRNMLLFIGDKQGFRSVIISILGLVFLYLLMKEIPLRICRGMFVCPAGEKEKNRYLLQQLSIKMIFSFLFLFVITFLYTGKWFLEGGVILNVIQLGLWFFTILDINLRIGMGERGARRIDAKGYAVYSKAEIAMNEYWFGTLVVENLLLYTWLLVKEQLSPVVMLIISGVAFLLNIYVVIRYAKSVIKEGLSYEAVYCQEPEKEVVLHEL